MPKKKKKVKKPMSKMPDMLIGTQAQIDEGRKLLGSTTKDPVLVGKSVVADANAGNRIKSDMERFPDGIKIKKSEIKYEWPTPTKITRKYIEDEKSVQTTSAVIMTISDRNLTIQKNQKRPTSHQLHLFTRLIYAEMRMLLRKGNFNNAETISVSYRIEKRSKK